MKKKLKKFLKKHDAWKKFKKNLKKRVTPFDFKEDNISSAFIWDDTDEGQKFWEKINDEWIKIK